MKQVATKENGISKTSMRLHDIDVELGVLARIAFQGEEPSDSFPKEPISAFDLEDMEDYAEHQIHLASGKTQFSFPNPEAKGNFEPIIPELIENARSNESMARRILALLKLRKKALAGTPVTVRVRPKVATVISVKLETPREKRTRKS